MKRKGWVVPILVFIFSLSILCFYQKNQATVSFANTTDIPPILWSESPSNINKITYSYGSKIIKAAYKDSSWTLCDYNNQKVDDLYIYNILNNFSEPIFNQVIEVSPKDLSLYGIDDSCPTLSLYDTEGNEYTLMQGDKIDDSLSYVYAPLSDTVYSMDTSIFSNLKISEVDWLNKQLLTFKLEDVASISFSYKSLQATLTPTKSDDGTIAFTSNNINDTLAAEFVHFLQTSKIEHFIASSANEHVLNIYGFNSPVLKCTITLNTGNSLSLTIGNINESENTCYAMVNNNNSIVAIPYFDFSQFSAMYAALHGSNSTQLG
ncbi:MAG: DUF4340 domain-containing protein [Cellulosilyticum sp.]|nr:DUF4340 domain-containing protein [Cellulosilyticum sp.]